MAACERCNVVPANFCFACFSSAVTKATIDSALVAQRHTETREALWREYVDLLSESLTGFAALGMIHGMRTPEATVQRGRELRDALGIEEPRQ